MNAAKTLIIKEIYEAEKKKKLPEKRLLSLLQEKGLTEKEAEELCNQAIEKKILAPGLDAEVDPTTGQIKRKYIVLTYMTQEDWEAERAMNQAEEEIWKTRKQLHPEEY